jgi:hypothetical protein
MEEQKASVFSIIWNDYVSFLAALFPILSWVFYFFFPLIDGKAMPASFLYIVIGASVSGLVILIWRLRLIMSTFEDGISVDGNIIHVSFFRDRGRVTYIYEFQGERYQSSNAIMKTKRTKALAQGQATKIIVSRDNPKLAFIRDLYQ